MSGGGVDEAALERELRERFGFSAFRAHQREVIDSVLQGRPTLAVMPTGAGKSLCYQLPALLLPGLTVVVSPLIALMKDQVDALAARGIAATFVNSTLGERERYERTAAAVAGAYKLLYVAPERFRSPRFVALLEKAPLALFAVDEAHCISQWGHDFRPDYARLGEFRARLRAPRTLALTATATPAVRRDICQALRLADPRVLVAGFDRPNLFLEVRRVGSEREKAALAGGIAGRGGSGIVYAATRRSTERMAAHLAAQGFPVLCYHAGLPDAQRRAVQDAFMQQPRAVVVATNAFGMGVDKADLRFVVHVEIPRSLEAYYQEIGRAGRDGERAQAVLLFNHADVFLHERMIEAAHPSLELVGDLWDLLRRAQAEGARGPLDGGAGRLAEALRARETQVQAALKVLEQAGHLERGGEPTAWIAVRRPLPQVVLPERAPAQRAAFLAVAAALGEASEGEIHLEVEAARVGMTCEAFRRALAALEAAGHLAVRPLSRSLRLLAPPSLPREALRVDRGALELRKGRERALLRAMTRYAYARNCRRRFLLGYFGEGVPGGSCGACDGCCGTSLVALPAGGRPAPAATRPVQIPLRAPASPPPGRGTTQRKTLELFRGGMGVAEIARTRQLNVDTVLRHLAELAQAGERLDVARAVAPERAERILEAAREAAPFLAAIKRALPPDFLWGEIQVVLAARRQRLLPATS